MKLRKMTQDDLSFLLSVRNHESTRKFLKNDAVFTLEECQEWFSNLEHEWFIIEVEDAPVGYIRTADNEEVGLDIHMDYRNRGYAKMAYQIFLENKERARLWVFDDNFAKKLYENLGFRYTGIEERIRGRKYIEMIYEKIPSVYW